jgi:hypothetical protein
MPPTIKPTHKAILAYYAALQDLTAQNVSHEMGLRRAFQTLLADTAKLADWTLITEQSFPPDATTERESPDSLPIAAEVEKVIPASCATSFPCNAWELAGVLI